MEKIKVTMKIGDIFRLSEGQKSLSAQKQKPVFRYALSAFKQVVENERNLIVEAGLATDPKIIDIQREFDIISAKNIKMEEKIKMANEIREENKELLEKDIETQKELEKVLSGEKEFEFIKLEKNLVDINVDYSETEWECILLLTGLTEEELIC